MRVFVTGAGGNLGRATMPGLADAGHTPVAFDFRPVETPFDFIEGDLREPASVLVAAESCDAVVHAARTALGKARPIAIRSWAPVLGSPES